MSENTGLSFTMVVCKKISSKLLVFWKWSIYFLQINKPVAGGRVVSELDCYAEGLLFKTSILPLLKHAYVEQWPTAMLPIKRLAGVAPELNHVEIRLSRGDVTRNPK